MQHADYFKNTFLPEVVNLNQSRLDKLDGRVDAVYGALSADARAHDHRRAEARLLLPGPQARPHVPQLPASRGQRPQPRQLRREHHAPLRAARLPGGTGRAVRRSRGVRPC